MHPVAWLSWVSLVMVLALVTTNPYYLALLLLCVLVVAALAPWSATGLAAFRVMLALGIGIGAFSILVAAVNGASGSHVLFDIPGPEFPDWLGGLRLGGSVTLEALVGASLRALAILCVFLAFAVFSGAVSPPRLLRLAPASMFHASLVVTVGLTLLPSIIADTRRIREMQLLRGGHGGIRGLPGLVVPAMLGGLERSLRLAEAMEARGYAAAEPVPATARFAGIAALPLLLAAGWAHYYAEGGDLLAAALATAGAAGLALWLAGAARVQRRTRLRADPIGRLQGTIAVISMAGSAVLPFIRPALGFGYNPFAGLPAPAFEALPATLTVLAGWPVVFLAAKRSAAASPAAEPVRSDAVALR